MTENTTVPAPIDDFIAAVNRHDEAAFLDSFTAEGSVDDWGRIFAGREAIKGWSDGEFIGANGTLTVEEVSTEGEAIHVVGDWRSTHANGRSAFTFTTEGDKIVRMTIREG
ncbi:nuclear transport factor 2 family protein [Ornithinimicrobium sp. INDO-MA30-4]|uniref:nuclear transport factor 2 family protein n=1 Tax=Ornithinimicrobium sp. INDO-MA30-4 TaxID=2908651 RepID=UPI001F23F7E7|nr:nuclear transport factor 2 family protein [Ornithinimicrobium sp. INDO-MA30-4]UJH70354.1 nuclear transport factor 2 family protein [Ornithinimicrobium sp. INDO-MA30-4]